MSTFRQIENFETQGNGQSVANSVDVLKLYQDWSSNNSTARSVSDTTRQDGSISFGNPFIEHQGNGGSDAAGSIERSLDSGKLGTRRAVNHGDGSGSQQGDRYKSCYLDLALPMGGIYAHVCDDSRNEGDRVSHGGNNSDEVDRNSHGGNERTSVFDTVDKNNDEQISAKEWTDTFESMDLNHDGKVGLKTFYGKFGHNQDAIALFNKADANQDGDVDEQEWLKALTKAESPKDSDVRVSREELDKFLGKNPTESNDKKIFNAIDANKDKSLSAKEWIDTFDGMDGDHDGKVDLKSFYDKFGHNEDTKALFDKADENHDGQVDEVEWVKAYTKVESTTDGDSRIGQDELSAFLAKDRGDGDEKKIFRKIDSNKDEKISAGEWVGTFESMDRDRDGNVNLRSFYQKFGDNDAARALFGKADENGDGKVDESEWVKTYAKVESRSDNDTRISEDELSNFLKKAPDEPKPPKPEPPDQPKPPQPPKPEPPKPEPPENPPGGGDGHREPVEQRDGHAEGIYKASPDKIEKLMRQVEANRDVSQAYINEVKEALTKLPAAVVEAMLSTGTSITIARDASQYGATGAAGIFAPGQNAIVVFENQSKGRADVVVAAEAAHAWDLMVAGISSSPEFRQIWNNRVANPPAGFHTPIEAMMAPIIHLSGARDPRAEATLKALPGLEELVARMLRNTQHVYA